MRATETWPWRRTATRIDSDQIRIYDSQMLGLLVEDCRRRFDSHLVGNPEAHASADQAKPDHEIVLL